jgi:ABC-type nickel/cobalt efflux system permease component RcnA
VTVLIFILGIFLAFVLGAFHSLAPGHGKSIMVAGALAEKGKRRDVIQLAVTMGLTHTVGVFVLAVIVFIGFTNSTYAVLKYLSFLSGVAIAITGLAFLLQRSRLFLNGSQTSNMHFDDHDHPHDHSHDHPHPHVPTTQTGISARRIALMGIAGGMVPTPSALTIILGTASLGTAWYGIILVIAYGLGMSSVLILAGYTMMKIYSTLERSLKPSTKFGKLLKLVPSTTAAFQIAAGIFLIYISRVWQLWSL